MNYKRSVLTASTNLFRTPSSILLDPTFSSAFKNSAMTTAVLPMSVRRTSAAPPPDPSVVSGSSSNNSIPLDNLSNLDVLDGKPGFSSLDSSSIGPNEVNSFASYYTGTISTVSTRKIVVLSVTLVSSVLIFSSIENALSIPVLPLSLGISLIGVVLLKFFVPLRFVISSPSTPYFTLTPPGSSVQVAAVHADKARLYRAVALGVLQMLYILLYAYCSKNESMTSLHMNFFSVLPPLDLVLQKFLLKVPIATTKRTIAAAVINIVPQALALYAWDWTVALEGAVLAVLQTGWVYVVFLEQAATESYLWMSTVYVGFQVSSAILAVTQVGYWMYTFVEGYEGAFNSTSSILVQLLAAVILAVAILAFFLSAGFLIKWSSSAHIIVLISTSSAFLIALSTYIVSPWIKFLGMILLSIGWLIYVK
ncbi:hypothetical protein V1511DRAFT_507475 [Dipodascopsis uninucleata]